MSTQNSIQPATTTLDIPEPVAGAASPDNDLSTAYLGKGDDGKDVAYLRTRNNGHDTWYALNWQTNRFEQLDAEPENIREIPADKQQAGGLNYLVNAIGEADRTAGRGTGRAKAIYTNIAAEKDEGLKPLAEEAANVVLSPMVFGAKEALVRLQKDVTGRLGDASKQLAAFAKESPPATVAGAGLQSFIAQAAKVVNPQTANLAALGFALNQGTRIIHTGNSLADFAISALVYTMGASLITKPIQAMQDKANENGQAEQANQKWEGAGAGVLNWLQERAQAFSGMMGNLGGQLPHRVPEPQRG